jgi:hypothetical protein
LARKERGFPREEKIEEKEAGVKDEGVASFQKALAEPGNIDKIVTF